MHVQMYTDYACPFCYAGRQLIKKLSSEFDVNAEYCYYMIHADMPDNGCLRKFIMTDARAEDINRRLAPFYSEFGITAAMGERVSSSRLAILVREYIELTGCGKTGIYDDTVYAEYFEKQSDIGDGAVISNILEKIGLDKDIITFASRDIRCDEKIRDNRRRAHGKLISIVPTILIGSRRISGIVPYDVLRSAVCTA